MSEAPAGIKKEAGGISSIPWVRIIEGNTVCDSKGEPTFETFDFTDKDYDTTNFVIVAPNISLHKLGDLKRILARDADACELDLGVSINGSLDGEKEKETERWELGWDDYRRVSIDVFPKEFFESQPNAKEMFEQKIIPKFASWNEMNSPSYGHK